jgi:hypothetical protein
VTAACMWFTMGIFFKDVGEQQQGDLFPWNAGTYQIRQLLQDLIPGDLF